MLPALNQLFFYKIQPSADGQAYEAQRVGEGMAAAYKAQTDVIGPERVAAIKLIEEIAAGKVLITPNVLIFGDGNAGGGLLNAILATWLGQNTPQKSEDKKNYFWGRNSTFPHW